MNIKYCHWKSRDTCHLILQDMMLECRTRRCPGTTSSMQNLVSQWRSCNYCSGARARPIDFLVHPILCKILWPRSLWCCRTCCWRCRARRCPGTPSPMWLVGSTTVPGTGTQLCSGPSHKVTNISQVISKFLNWWFKRKVVIGGVNLYDSIVYSTVLF